MHRIDVCIITNDKMPNTKSLNSVDKLKPQGLGGERILSNICIELFAQSFLEMEIERANINLLGHIAHPIPVLSLNSRVSSILRGRHMQN